jgi:plasmid replication initiation protein
MDSKYTTSDGVPWGKVKWSDLPKIIERGKKADALLAAREKLEAEMRELAKEAKTE